tara:strand:+ start:1139 stop:1816 length:678 start_codon:yes stop_codon:yes gene_type:complete
MIFPKHVAIIMDGNGRWGLKKNKSRNYGHKQGIKTVKKIINASINKKIKFLTLYTFSTENWKRPINEVNYLLKLLETFIDKEMKNLIKKGIKLKIIGGLYKFSNKLKKKLKQAEVLTKKNKKIQVNIALNYGSREEIITSVKKLINKSMPINEKNISKFLYTKDIPDPDLLIRTGNRNRLSNFLMWQSIYSEIFFEKKLWPEFNEKDFYKIIRSFKKIKRNFGGL